MTNVYVDGSGKGTFGYYIEDDEVSKVIHGVDVKTHNVAEYMAIVAALKECVKREYENITIYSDSLVVVNQINREYAVTKDHLRVLAIEVWTILEALKAKNVSVSIVWIPREQNKAGKMLG